MPPAPSRILRTLLGLLVVLGLFAAVFGAELAGLAERFLGLEYVDHYGTQWFYWYTERQLRAGQGFGHTDLFFFPWGKDVFAHTGSNVLDGVLALPFRAVFGPVLGYNLFVLAGMLATGGAFWLLARDHSDDRLACGVGAALFTLSPYLLHDLTEGRPTQAIVVAPVLFLWQLLRVGRRPGLAAPVLAGLFLAISGYQYWFYALFGGLAALAHGLWLLARPLPDSGGRAATFARHALMAAVALVLVSPVAVPLAAAAASDGEVPGLLDVSTWSLRASPPVTVEGQTIGLFVWQPLRRWSGFHVLDDGLGEHLLDQALLLPWFWPLILLLWAWRPGRLPRGATLAAALVLMVLATGSVLVVGAHALPNPPFVWLSQALGVMQRLWWPARALALFTVLLGLMLVVLLDQLGRRAPRLQLAAVLLVSGLWAAELRAAGHVPFPSWDATVPAGYRCLADGPQGAVIELPHAWTQAHLYYQSVHGRPIMGGMLENNPVFTPPEVVTLRQDNTFVATLATASRLGADAEPFTAEDKQAVYDLGYRYVLLQKDAHVRPPRAGSRHDNVQRTRLRRLQKGMRRMLGEPVYDDARIIIFAPWGDPAPCAPDAVESDRVARGPTELHADAMVHGELQDTELERVWSAELDDLVELATDLPTEPPIDTGAAPSVAPAEDSEDIDVDGLRETNRDTPPGQ